MSTAKQQFIPDSSHIADLRTDVVFVLSIAGAVSKPCRYEQPVLSRCAVPIMTPPTVAPGSAVVMRRHGTSPDAVPSSFCVSSPMKHPQQSHMVSHCNALQCVKIKRENRSFCNVYHIQLHSETLYLPTLCFAYHFDSKCLLFPYSCNIDWFFFWWRRSLFFVR